MRSFFPLRSVGPNLKNAFSKIMQEFFFSCHVLGLIHSFIHWLHPVQHICLQWPSNYITNHMWALLMSLVRCWADHKGAAFTPRIPFSRGKRINNHLGESPGDNWKKKKDRKQRRWPIHIHHRQHSIRFFRIWACCTFACPQKSLSKTSKKSPPIGTNVLFWISQNFQLSVHCTVHFIQLWTIHRIFVACIQFVYMIFEATFEAV